MDFVHLVLYREKLSQLLIPCSKSELIISGCDIQFNIARHSNVQ